VAASSWELIERHLREPPPPLPERSAADGALLPAALRTLIVEMLGKSPLARPTMAQVAARLHGLLPEESQGPRSQPARLVQGPALSRQARRRRRLLGRLGLTALGLLVLISLAGLGHYAHRQRRLAVRQRQQTLAATAEILTIIRRTLRPMPGANAASQGLLDLTGRQLTTLFEQLPDDLEVAEALVRLHSLRGDFARHHGGLSTAKSEFEAAIQGAQQLVSARPSERQYRLLLANAHDGLGDALEQVADLQQARSQYEKALSLRQELMRAAPADSLPAQEVVGSHLLLGDLAQAQGRQRSALAAYEQALALLTPLWKREPDNKAYRWQMCGIHYRSAQTLLYLGRSVDALAMAERAVDLLTRISPTDQQGSSYHLLYSRVLQVRGLAREQLGRREEAAADLRQSFAEVSALLKAAPNDVQAKRAVIDSGLRLIDSLLHSDQRSEAGPLASELLRIAESLFTGDDKNHGHRWRLAATLQRVGDVELRAGQVGTAQARYARALELQESLHMAAPEAARHRDRLVALFERLGDAASAGPYSVQALPHYDEALRQIAVQEQIEAGWLELRLSQARILRKRAAVQQKLGRSSLAQQDQQQSVAILRALRTQDPASAILEREQQAAERALQSVEPGLVRSPSPAQSPAPPK
jgi:tetratricopeptide (TPR) repeat protein